MATPSRTLVLDLDFGVQLGLDLDLDLDLDFEVLVLIGLVVGLGLRSPSLIAGLGLGLGLRSPTWIGLWFGLGPRSPTRNRTLDFGPENRALVKSARPADRASVLDLDFVRFLAYNAPQQAVHHPHKMGLQEPELEPKLQHQLCRSGWRHGPSAVLPRHKTYTCTHMHAVKSAGRR
jgi:hypothetical protein